MFLETYMIITIISIKMIITMMMEIMNTEDTTKINISIDTNIEDITESTSKTKKKK